MNLKILSCALIFVNASSIACEEIPMPSEHPSLPASEKQTDAMSVEAYNSFLSDGYPITDKILQEMGDVPVSIITSIHDEIFRNASIEDQAFTFMCAIMEDQNKYNTLMRRKIIPTFWKAVNTTSSIGKHIVPAASFMFSIMYLALPAFSDASENMNILKSILAYCGVSINMNNNIYNDLLRIFNVAALLTAQIGNYVFANIYNYSLNMKKYFSNANYEKKYLKATMTFDGDYDKLPAQYRPGRDLRTQIDVPEEYCQQLGPVFPCVIRNVLTLKKYTPNQLGKIKEKALEEKSLNKMYCSISKKSLWSGVLHVFSGSCVLINTSLLAVAATLPNSLTGQIFTALAIPFNVCSTIFSWGANKLETIVGNRSKEFLLYTYYNQELIPHE